MRWDRRTLVSVLSVVLVAAAAWFLSGQGEEATAPTTTSPSPSVDATATNPDVDDATAPASPSASSTTGATAVVVPAGFETITAAELPPEAVDTLSLIESGGPYPYDADDDEFQNRERLLPEQPDGYYREYTVETPGSDDRGGRRIVTGADGEMFYTDDHYDSFRVIVP